MTGWALILRGGDEAASTVVTVAVIVAIVLLPIAVGLVWRLVDRRRGR